MKQRKIITWVLVLLMALFLFSVAALADEAEETGSEEIAEETASEEPTEETASEEIVEETSSNALVLTTALTAASGNGWELDDNGKLTISSDTGMSNWASSRSTYAEKVTSVEIASGVTSISASAFANCSNLTAITIPASVKSIGNNAFWQCTELTSVTFGASSQLETIGGSAFNSCSKLTAIEIPANVTAIGDSAFANCTKLTAITIPANVTTIGASAFHGCTELTEITIPNSVTSMGASAFQNCSKLTTVTIGSGITTIEEYTFYGCAVLTAVTIPANITTVGHYAFWNCSSLTDVTMACGTTYKSNSFTSAAVITLNHTWGDTAYAWDEVNKTCTATRTCTVCQEDETETVTGTGETTLEPTCTEEGQTTYTAEFTQTWAANPTALVLTNIEANGHGTTVLQNAKAAACTEAGYTGDLVCTVCNAIVEEGETIPATGHSFGAWETVESPSCEDDGSEQRVCTVCGYIETQGVDPTGHQWETEYTIDKAATCTTEGSQSIHCANCDAVKDVEVIPATGHSYEAEVTAATYTARGYTVYTCSACGDSYEGDYTPILTIDVTDDSIEIRPVLEPLTAVPESLTALYSTVDALSSELLSRVTVSQGYTTENAAVYDIKLQFRVDGGEWMDATEDNFPLGGIPVTLPYPDGTDSSYEFTAVHMFTVTSDRLGITAGDTETLTVTNTTEGMDTIINGCSPIAIAWKEADTPTTPSPSPTAEATATPEPTVSAEPTATAAASPASTAPSTGDEESPMLWAALVILCAAGLGAALTLTRKGRE